MKKHILFLLIVCVALSTSIVTFLVIGKGTLLQITHYPMDVTITDQKVFGVNVDTDGFHFGTIMPGQGSFRELSIHDVTEDAYVIITMTGEMSNWISNPNNFLVQKGEERNITFALAVPMNASLGTYTGNVTILLRKV